MTRSGQQGAITVRQATAADVAAVTAIERESFTLPWSKSSFANLLRSAAVQFLVAIDDDGTVIGYAIILRAVDTHELANLAVATGQRGRGIGRRLLNTAIENARASEARDMFLEVRASNMSAQALYASVGFREVARRRRYYDKPVEDALVLRLDLRAHVDATEGVTST